jgi:hypothetical protein
MSEKLRYTRERHYCPHHILINAAYTALEDARSKKPGYADYELMCITFCSLALEALGNSFGEKLIPRWINDFESASPAAKIRLVCQRINITPDFGSEPWQTATWLIRFRNRVAHAKPKRIREDSIVTREEREKMRFQVPQSELEKEISLENAEKAFKCVDGIHEMWCAQIPMKDMENLLGDGWSGETSPIRE